MLHKSEREILKSQFSIYYNFALILIWSVRCDEPLKKN